jgi:hypothetical protein
MIRREGFNDSLALLSADDEAPYDRPNSSKDCLAGRAPEDWLRLANLTPVIPVRG